MEIEKKKRRLKARLMFFVFIGSYLLTQVLTITSGFAKVFAADGVSFTSIQDVNYIVFNIDGAYTTMYGFDIRVQKGDGIDNAYAAINGAVVDSVNGIGFTLADPDGGCDNSNSLWSMYQASYCLDHSYGYPHNFQYSSSNADVFDSYLLSAFPSESGFTNAQRQVVKDGIRYILEDGYPNNKDYWSANGVENYGAQAFATQIAIWYLLTYHQGKGNTGIFEGKYTNVYEFVNNYIRQWDVKERNGVVKLNEYYGGIDGLVDMIAYLTGLVEDPSSRVEADITVNSFTPSIETIGGTEYYKVSFEVDAKKLAGYRAALTGVPVDYTVYVNGNEVAVDGNGYFTSDTGQGIDLVEVLFLRAGNGSTSLNQKVVSLKAEAEYAIDMASLNYYSPAGATVNGISRQNMISSFTPQWGELDNEDYAVMPIDAVDLTIYKYDGVTHIGLQGAIFEVWDENETNLIGTYTTGADGKVTLTGIEVDTIYKVKEISAPNGYLIGSGVYEIELSDPDGETLNVSNYLITDIEITKTDSLTGDVLAGASFGIYSDAACQNLIQTITTGANGVAKSTNLTYLPSRTKVYVKETQAPTNYVLDSTVHEIALDGQTAKIELALTNEPDDGVIIINKKDAYTAGALSGATFGIYSDVTCTDASLVTTLTTGADGSVRSGDLPAGTYYIRETIAPDGFVITEETKQVTIGWAVPEVEVEFTNERSPGKIVITKTDSLTGATMAGVTFDIFSDANCTNLIESIVTNSNGVAESSLLTYGTYYIKESGVVAGYQANTTVYSATVGYKITSVSVAVENIPNNGVIKVNKTDSLTGDVIQGVVFDIYTDANCTNLVERITTGANGVATSSPLTPKTYYVKEISTVNGFILSTEVKSATVGYTVTEVTLDFENTPQNGKVTITKTDSLTGDRIAGVVFGIYSDANCTNLIEQITTNANGIAESSMMAPQTVYIREIATVAGFILSTEIKSATVGYTNVNVPVSFENTPQNGKVTITKTDSLTGNAIQGVVFGIYSDANCTNLIEQITTNANGIAESSMMAPQTVYIREIATVAGFILSTEIKEVSVGYTNTNVEISYENTPNNGKIIIEKVDSANGATLEGAVFGIYSDLACTQLVEKITTGANGKAISSALVPGKYFYRELVAPIGYVIDNTVSSVEVGYTITEVTVTAVNDAQLGKITIYKKGPVLKGFEDGKFIYEDAYLSGVVFGVYDIAGNKLMEIVTVDGIAETPLLKLGKYTIKELNASNGYIMSEQTYEAELVYDAQVVSVDASISVKNDIQRAEIQIKKVSSLDKTPLASAKFNLVTLKEIKAFDGSILFEANDVITTLVTDSSGMAITDIAMPYGEYELIEVEAPKGYVIANATNKVVFEFDRTKEKDRVFDVEVENDPIQIKINKLDSVSLEQLAGAKLVIKDMDGNIVYGPFITGDSAELIYALPAGKYMLEEIEAPTGYLTASAEFTIENISDLQEFALIDQAVFGSITFEYDNTSDVITMPEIYEAPKTGDFMDMMKYLVLALISGICLLGAALKKKRAVIAGVMVMMAVMLPSKVMAETRTYTDEKVFASKTGEGYEDDSLFEKEVVIDGVKYKLDKIDYSVKEKIFTSDEVLTFTMEHTILSGEQYEFADTVERDGYSYVLKEVLDNERVVSGRKWFASQTVSYFDYVTVDNISEYCEVVKDDEVSGERIVAKIPYVETVVSNRRWQDDFRFNVVFTVNSNDGAAYFKLGNKLIPYKEDTPNLDGYEEYLLKTMGLDVECYKIHSIEWKSAAEVDGNGNLKRVAVATGERLVSDFEIKYSGEVALKDVVYHDLTANYEVVVQVPTGEKEYEVTAVATYLEVEEEPTVADDKAPDEKPEESNLVKTVLTSLTVFIVILLIVIVLAFVLRRKKVNRY